MGKLKNANQVASAPVEKDLDASQSRADAVGEEGPSVDPLPPNLRRRLNRLENRTKKREKLPVIPIIVVSAVLMTFFAFLFKLTPEGFRQPVHPDLSRHPADPPTELLAELSAFPYRDQTLWGSYRPGFYMGLRMRVPRSLVFGMMWWDHMRGPGAALQSLRHEARHEDGMKRFGWTEHDGRSYGRQEVEDGDLRVDMSFAKRWPGDSGPGGDWAVRVAADRLESEESAAVAAAAAADPAAPRPRVASFLLYMGEETEAEGLHEVAPKKSQFKVYTSPGVQSTDAPGVIAFGNQLTTGQWALHLVPQAGDPQLSCILSTAKANLRQPSFHNLTDTVKSMLADHFMTRRAHGEDPRSLKLQDYVSEEEGNNLGMIQVTVRLPCTFDVVFVSGLDDSTPKSWREGVRWRSAFAAAAAESADAAPWESDPDLKQLRETYGWDGSDVHYDVDGQDPRVAALSGPGLTALLAKRSAAHHARLETTFGPFAAVPDGPTAERLRTMISAAVSNLVGGIGYFFGRSIVHTKTAEGAPAYGLTFAAPLVTAVPSRAFFPRGFLWDEGFHQLILGRWDAALSRDCLAHWLGLMTASGWIPREQILGEEARSRVPREFIGQRPSHANPPALALAVAVEVQRAMAGDARAAAFLRAVQPRFNAWVRWFNASQTGAMAGAYYWHGREGASIRELNPKSLSSGLDDYPRASHPDSLERHLDLRCWMTMVLDTLRDLNAAVPPAPSALPGPRLEASLALLTSLDALTALHLDDASGMFLDYGYHTEDLLLRRRAAQDGGESELVRAPRAGGEPPTYRHVPHFGYVSLFPLIAGLLPPASAAFGRQLELLRDESLIWSAHGLRSLSKSSSMYQKHNTEHDPPYWRGAVWININYLTLRALKAYSLEPGPYAARANEIYNELRANILRTVGDNFESTGYLWEQYSDSEGRGKGTHPFTGWTALVALIAGEHYPPAMKILN